MGFALELVKEIEKWDDNTISYNSLLSERLSNKYKDSKKQGMK